MNVVGMLESGKLQEAEVCTLFSAVSRLEACKSARAGGRMAHVW